MATKTLEITAGTSGFESALTSATASLVEATATWKESLASVKESFSAVGEAMLAVGAIMAGGKMFGDMVQSTVKLNVESRDLGKQFGISATEASVLKAALAETHVTQEQFSGAAARIARTLNTNEGAFKSLGVATRDVNGNFRPLADIVLDTNTALLQFKEGTDRNIEAQKVYGRGAQEFAATFRLTRAAMSDAKGTVDDLGLAVTKESQAMTGQYQDAMVRVQHTLEGIENAVGQEVIPVLTELGNWFRSIGPEVIQAFRISLEGLKVIFGAVTDAVGALGHAFADFVTSFREGQAQTFGTEPIGAMQFFANVLRIVEVAFIGFRTAVQLTVAVIQNEFEYLEDLAHGWATVIERAFHLDWAGVRAAWKAGQATIEADLAAHAARLVAIATKAQADMNEALTAVMGQPPKGTPTDAPPGGKTSDGGAKDQIAKELEAWQRELALEYAALEKHHKAEMLVYQAQEQEFAKNAAARVAIAEQEVAAEMTAYGKGSPQYEAAQKHLIDVKRQAAEQSAQIAATFDKMETTRQLAAVADDEKNLQTKYQHHEISSAQLEAGEIELENRRTAIAEAGINARLALIDKDHDPGQFAQLNAQLESLELQHAQKISDIKKQAAQRDQQTWNALNTAIESSFAKSINDMLTKSQSFGTSLRGLFTGVMGAVANVFAQTAAKNITTMLEQAAVGKSIRAKEMLGDAEKAASGAYSAIAGIPYVGPFLAPAAAAAAFAATMAFSSAEGGYDIPAGVNPMTQLHEREMVLPAWAGDVIRSLGAGGGGGGGVHTHNYGDVNMSDTNMKRLISSRAGQRMVFDGIASAVRRGARP